MLKLLRFVEVFARGELVAVLAADATGTSGAAGTGAVGGNGAAAK